MLACPLTCQHLHCHRIHSLLKKIRRRKRELYENRKCLTKMTFTSLTGMMKSVELKAKNRAVPSSTSLPHSRILAADITSPHSQNFNLSMTKEQSCQLPVQIQVHFSAQSCSSVLSVASSPPLSAPISLLFSQDLSFSPWPPSLIRCELHIICRFGLGQHLRWDSPFEGTLLTGRCLPLSGQTQQLSVVVYLIINHRSSLKGSEN